MIYAALDRFATEITRGQEEVMLAVFATGGANFLLPDWSGDASEVSRALNDYDRNDGASDSPNALLATNPLLAERRGSRSILLITDAETGFNATPDMWRRSPGPSRRCSRCTSVPPAAITAKTSCRTWLRPTAATTRWPPPPATWKSACCAQTA